MKHLDRAVRGLMLGAVLITAPGVALAAIPVIDNAVLDKRTDRDGSTSEIETTDKDRFTVNKSVTCSMYRPGRRDDPASAVQANPEISGLVRRIAREEGVNETEFLALVYQESRFNPCAQSGAGAYGLAQLMPGTAAELGVNPYNIEQNLRGGARYYKQQLRAHNGNRALALAAYNAGAGNVRKYGGIPPFKETQGYVRAIENKWIPALGGADLSSIPLNYGGGSSAYVGMRDATLGSMATTQAMSDSHGNVASWLQQLGGTGTATIQDSWDLNSSARNANLEMINQAIKLAGTIAQLVNSRNTMEATALSSATRTVRRPEPDGTRETAGVCSERDGQVWDEQRRACVERLESPDLVDLQLEPEEDAR